MEKESLAFENLLNQDFNGNEYIFLLNVGKAKKKTFEHPSSARGNFFKLRKLFTNIIAIF